MIMVFVITPVSSSPKRLLTTTTLSDTSVSCTSSSFPLVFILLFNYINHLLLMHIIKMRKFCLCPTETKNSLKRDPFLIQEHASTQRERITLQQIYRKCYSIKVKQGIDLHKAYLTNIYWPLIISTPLCFGAEHSNCI